MHLHTHCLGDCLGEDSEVTWFVDAADQWARGVADGQLGTVGLVVDDAGGGQHDVEGAGGRPDSVADGDPLGGEILCREVGGSNRSGGRLLFWRTGRGS